MKTKKRVHIDQLVALEEHRRARMLRLAGSCFSVCSQPGPRTIFPLVDVILKVLDLDPWSCTAKNRAAVRRA